jgi:hypothetical protein
MAAGMRLRKLVAVLLPPVLEVELKVVDFVGVGPGLVDQFADRAR